MTPTSTPSRGTLIGVAALIVFAALSRLIPHSPNFSPIESIALFGGAAIASRRLAILIPIGAMALSDAILGWHTLVPVTYGCIALIALAGQRLGRRQSVLRVAGFGLASAVFFFAVSNFFVWLTSGMYVLTLGGLAECYVAALPFFQNELAGVAVYSTLLFGAAALWRQQVAAGGTSDAA